MVKKSKRNKKISIKKKSLKKKIKIIKSFEKIEELKEDKSNLEDAVKELEKNINKNKFIELPKINFKSSPVLEKVADAPRQVMKLEQDIANVIPKNSKDNQPKYITNSNESNYTTRNEETENQGTDYQLNQSATQPQRMNIETAGKNLHPAIREAVPINRGFQENVNKGSDYIAPPKQLERITPNSSLEKRKTEAQELESHMKKYEIR